jgi:hypothetical protein
VDILINTLGMKSVRTLDWLCVEPVIAYDPYENTNRENLAFGIEGKNEIHKDETNKNDFFLSYSL